MQDFKQLVESFIDIYRKNPRDAALDEIVENAQRQYEKRKCKGIVKLLNSFTVINISKRCIESFCLISILTESFKREKLKLGKNIDSYWVKRLIFKYSVHPKYLVRFTPKFRGTTIHNSDMVKIFNKYLFLYNQWDMWDLVSISEKMVNRMIDRRICPFINGKYPDILCKLISSREIPLNKIDSIFYSRLLFYMSKWKRNNGEWVYDSRANILNWILTGKRIKWRDERINIFSWLLRTQMARNNVFPFIKILCEIGGNINCILKDLCDHLKDDNCKKWFPLLFRLGLRVYRINSEEMCENWRRRVGMLERTFESWRRFVCKKRMNRILIDIPLLPGIGTLYNDSKSDFDSKK